MHWAAALKESLRCARKMFDLGDLSLRLGLLLGDEFPLHDITWLNLDCRDSCWMVLNSLAATAHHTERFGNAHQIADWVLDVAEASPLLMALGIVNCVHNSYPLATKRALECFQRQLQDASSCVLKEPDSLKWLEKHYILVGSDSLLTSLFVHRSFCKSLPLHTEIAKVSAWRPFSWSNQLWRRSKAGRVEKQSRIDRWSGQCFSTQTEYDGAFPRDLTGGQMGCRPSE